MDKSSIDTLVKLTIESVGLNYDDYVNHWKNDAKGIFCIKSNCGLCKDDDPYYPYLILRKAGVTVGENNGKD